MLECHEVPRLPRKTTWPQLLTRQKSHVFAWFCLFPSSTDGWGRLQTVANGCKRLQTVADGCGRLRTPKAGSREHRSSPRPPNVKREPIATHSGKTQKPTQRLAKCRTMEQNGGKVMKIEQKMKKHVLHSPKPAPASDFTSCDWVFLSCFLSCFLFEALLGIFCYISRDSCFESAFVLFSQPPLCVEP